MLTTLAVTGAALYGGWKLLRRSFPPAAPQTAAATHAAAAEIPFVGTPAWLTAVVHNNGMRQAAIITLTGATSAIHIALGLQLPYALFVWNGVGYALLLAGHYAVPQLAPYRGETRDLLAAYTGTTIVAYFVQRGVVGLLDPSGVSNKLIEGALLGLLWFEQETAAPAEAGATLAVAPIES
ncbi:MAG: hypothetical protein ACOYNY_01815 [Caldilineaceae bacterium]